MADQRDHDLGVHFHAAARGGKRAFKDRTSLHLDNLREDDAQAAAAQAHHRVDLVHALNLMQQLFLGGIRPVPSALSVATSAIKLSMLGRNSCSGGSIRRMVAGRPPSALKMPSKSARWKVKQLVELYLALGIVVGENHRLDNGPALLGEEHMLRAAKPDTLRAELDGKLDIFGRVGIGADTQLAGLVGPLQEGAELAGQLGGDHFDMPSMTSPVEPFREI